MDFNDEELRKILYAFGVQESETSLDDLSMDIMQRIKTHLKVKKCVYSEYHPNEETIDCMDRDCDTCEYSKNDF